MKEKNINNKEVRNMCDVAQRLKNEGYKEGFKAGYTYGVQQGMFLKFIENARKNGKTDAFIETLLSEFFELPKTEIQKLLKQK